MPVFLDSDLPGVSTSASETWLRGHSLSQGQGHTGECVTIGLINNMPDAALEATERQYRDLLSSVAGDRISIRLSLYTLPDIARSESSQRRIRSFYSSLEDLLGGSLDGLIVTGREPLTSNLKEEPYWGTLTRVLEWAQDNTHSTIWSCLAAHAAVLHLDGIGRRKSSKKHFGVFECARLSDHRLMAGTPSRFKLPHSRWNDVPEEELTDCGYTVISRALDAGVDTFVKQCKSLFVFFQGHPEYQSDTLLLEYRRDVGRYLRGETDAYPLMPRNYFDQDTVDELTAFKDRVISGWREELRSRTLTVLEGRNIANTWVSTATRVYANWLELIYEQKKCRLNGVRGTKSLVVRQHSTNSCR